MSSGVAGRAGVVNGTVAILVGAVLLAGCAPHGILTQKRYDKRERALALIDEGRKKENEGMPRLAMERYDRAARFYDSPQAWYQMGRLYEAQSLTKEAATAYQRALELAPDYQDARLAILALGYTPPGYTPTKEDLDLAQEWSAKREKEMSKIRAQAAAQDGQTSQSLEKRKEERVAVLAGAVQDRPPTPEEVRAALFPAGQEKEKLPSATRPVYANDQDIILGTYPYHYQKAERSRSRQQYEKAAEEYERALRADPRQLQARLDLGDMMRRLEREDRARLYYEKAMEDFPDSPRPMLKMGTYYKDHKQPDRAREYFRKALAKDPKYVEAFNNLGVMEMEEKNYTKAAQMFDQIIQLDPKYPTAYLNRGIIAGDVEHDRAAALRNFQKYVELNGPRAADVRKWIKDLENPER